MKAVRVYDYGGGKKQLVYEDVPQPRPRDDEVLVRVYAAGVTPVEQALRGLNRELINQCL